MLQNARVTAFTVSEILRKNQRGVGKGKIALVPPTQSPYFVLNKNINFS